MSGRRKGLFLAAVGMAGALVVMMGALLYARTGSEEGGQQAMQAEQKPPQPSPTAP